MHRERLSPADLALYEKQGYLVVQGFCRPDEVDKLYQTALDDDAMRKNALDLNDQNGKKNAAIAMVYPRQRCFWLFNPERANDQFGGPGIRWRRAGLSFPLQADAKGTESWGRLGMAPGLWLLVQKPVHVS